MQDRYTMAEFRGRHFYMDTVAFSPQPVDFCTGRVVEKGLDWIANSPKPRLSVLDFCSGQGCVGLSLFEEANGRVERVGYVDVNYFNLLALEKTLAELRDFSPEDMSRHEPILSNALKCLEAEDRYDLILCNPPHRNLGDGHPMTGDFSLKNLYLVDPGWRLHMEFYATVHEHLLPGGECWFIELQGSPREHFEEMIRGNPKLNYLGYHEQEKLGDELPSYYWMGCRLA
jgi:methylase of polypeptide subunit release factors